MFCVKLLGWFPFIHCWRPCCRWLETAGLRVGFDGLVTEPVLIAMTVITSLHLLVQIYAIGYMEMDWGWPRFFGSRSATARPLLRW